MRSNASEVARAKCMSIATTLPPSSAASPVTVGANIHRAAVIKGIIAAAKQERIVPLNVKMLR